MTMKRAMSPEKFGEMVKIARDPAHLSGSLLSSSWPISYPQE